MARALEGKRIAILVAVGFEQVELTRPQEALIDAGAETEIVSPDVYTFYGTRPYWER
jgi:protease I